GYFSPLTFPPETLAGLKPLLPTDFRGGQDERHGRQPAAERHPLRPHAARHQPHYARHQPFGGDERVPPAPRAEELKRPRRPPAEREHGAEGGEEEEGSDSKVIDR
uniref:Uncharacterized protein n=1 Tax=Oryza glumipatula TaxID=40148 RepID=A0A0D9YYX3_9ORYZ